MIQGVQEARTYMCESVCVCVCVCVCVLGVLPEADV